VRVPIRRWQNFTRGLRPSAVSQTASQLQPTNGGRFTRPEPVRQLPPYRNREFRARMGTHGFPAIQPQKNSPPLPLARESLTYSAVRCPESAKSPAFPACPPPRIPQKFAALRPAFQTERCARQSPLCPLTLQHPVIPRNRVARTHPPNGLSVGSVDDGQASVSERTSNDNNLIGCQSGLPQQTGKRSHPFSI
jgi:hypothetical protein